MKKFIQLLSLLFLAVSIQAQDNTVGLLSYDANKASEGYNLIFPHNQSSVFLLDNCGELVNTWTDDPDYRPANTAYLDEEGRLYKSKRNASVAGDAIWAGGGGAILEIRDWDNNLIWDFEMNDSIYRLHHDFAITETGNIVALAWELKNTDECVAAGRDTSTLAQGVLWPDWIFEIDPTTDEIVWEWHAWDHLIQDFDSTKSNFGVIAEHPELIDVNYGRVDGHPDWMHGNALDYFFDGENQMIMLSVPYFDEFFVIDKSTSTVEAAGSNGGVSNKGGDLMYRWGNPITHGQGTAADQRNFFQHDAHWVDNFLTPAHPYFGKIAIFNNRVGADYSTANVIDAPFDMYEGIFDNDNGFEIVPADFELIITHPDTQALYSTGLSSVQFLPNGNSLITSGRWGYSFEMTPNKEIVWEYKTPTIGTAIATQGDTLTINNNLTFRMDRYPVDFAGFDGKDLSPKGWIELNPNETYCDSLTPNIELMDEAMFKIYPNPTAQRLTVEWDGMVYADLKIFDALGRVQYQEMCNGGRKYLNTADWENGIFYVTITTNDSRYTRKLIVQH